MLDLRLLMEIFRSPGYRENYLRAKASGTCIHCGKPAVGFKDASSSLEYRVSALCQRCQDTLFSKH
jgi:hypothetical protein